MGDRNELESGGPLAEQPPDLAQIYNTIPIGLAFLTLRGNDLSFVAAEQKLNRPQTANQRKHSLN